MTDWLREHENEERRTCSPAEAHNKNRRSASGTKKPTEAVAVLALSLVGLDPEGIYDEAEIDAHLISWRDGWDDLSHSRCAHRFGDHRRCANWNAPGLIDTTGYAQVNPSSGSISG